MAERRPSNLESVVQQFAGDPVLGDFVAPWPNVLPGGQADLTAGFARMAELVGRGRRASFIRFTIADGTGKNAKVRRWHLGLTPKTCTVSEDDAGRADLEVLTTTDVWTAIAGGRLSPLAAFGQGKLRVRGDIGLARLFARRVHGRPEPREE